MAHPSLQRVAELVLQPLGDIEERRRARPAVQIFVAAPDREVAAGAVEVERDRSGAVRQVPDGQCASRMRRIVDRAHVVKCRRSVIDMSERNDRGVVANRRQHFLRFNRLQLKTEHVREPLRDIEVGREIALLREDRLALRPRLTAAASNLNRHTLVELAISNSFGFAPTIGASLAAMRVGQSIQSCFVQLAIRSSPHCCSAVRRSASGAAAGKAPSELPSR